VHPIFRLWWISIITTCALVELIAYDSHHEIFPKAICHTLSETNDPFSTRDVQRVLPHWLAHTDVEEEVICGRLEHRWRGQVCPDGPEGFNLMKKMSEYFWRPRSTDRTECGYFFDALFVVDVLVAGCTLLAEPKDPSEELSAGDEAEERHTCF